jgi:glyoxylate reductase
MTAPIFITRLIPETGLERIRGSGIPFDLNPVDRGLSRADLEKAVAGRQAILCQLTDTIDAALIEAARGCRIVANMAVGFNNIDVAAASARGILVSNTPGVLTESTADLTWALILAVARRVVEGDREMRSGRFTGWGPLYMLGSDVAGATLGLIGPGRIATAVARRAVGFGMTLLFHGPEPTAEIETLGARNCSLEELLRQSDFVSLHVPLLAETLHLIDRRALALMKPTAILINSSRGPVIDEAALVDALRSGQIAGAGLDVYEHEPLMTPGLADCPNTVLLPHLGSATLATRGAMARMAAENVLAALAGRQPPNLVNPEIWNTAGSRASVALDPLPLSSPE